MFSILLKGILAILGFDRLLMIKMKFRTAILIICYVICGNSCNEPQIKPSNDIPKVKIHNPILGNEIVAEKIQSKLNELGLLLFSQNLPELLANGSGWKAISEKLAGSIEDTRRLKVSIHTIKNEENKIHSQARIELKAQSIEKKFLGVIAYFDCYSQKLDNEEIKILSIDEPQKVVVNQTSQLWFSDQTSKVAENEPIFKHHLSKGLDHWLLRVESVHGIDAFINNGLALGDFNGDGLDDLYVCQPGGLPNRLLLHSKDGGIFSSPVPGSDYLDHTSSALFVDIDNDQDQDLCLATPSGIVLLENDNGKRLLPKGVLQTDDVDCHSLTATDYDLDGNLDLYITFALGSLSSAEESSFRFDDARDGGTNQLFKGDGKWSFSEVTSLTGLSNQNNRHSLAAAWHDYDHDGDPDLYIANDYGFNQLYRNDLKNGKRIFSEIAMMAGAQDRGAGMSVSWGDYNRDGLSDIYIGNMYSNAGNRITRMSGYLDKENASLKKIYRRFAKGNTLLVQNKDNKFNDYGPSVSMGRWAWSSVFADIDNDGWEDLVVANGYITGQREDDL